MVKTVSIEMPTVLKPVEVLTQVGSKLCLNLDRLGVGETAEGVYFGQEVKVTHKADMEFEIKGIAACDLALVRTIVIHDGCTFSVVGGRNG